MWDKYAKKPKKSNLKKQKHCKLIIIMFYKINNLNEMYKVWPKNNISFYIFSFFLRQP